MNSELFFDGKKYISAKRASQKSGYNSDYIGQLCRRGELDCRRIGRSWFVEEISLDKHHDEASKKPRGRIGIRQVEVNTSDLQGDQRHFVLNHSLAGLRHFKAEDCVDQVKDRYEAKRFAVRVTASLLVLLALIVSFPVVKNIHIPTRGSTHAQDLVLHVIPANALSGIANIFHVDGNKIALAIRNTRITTESMKLKMYHSLFVISNSFTSRMVDYAFLRSSDKTKFSRDHSGVVTVPSSGNDMVDEEVKQHVKDAFSDEVFVMPDGSGTSGAITPVFKKASEDDYMYVVVPVVDE